MTLTERLNRMLFQRVIKGVLNTPAIEKGNNSFAALSMVHHRDILPYLLAIKTFAHYANPDRIILVADPSLENEDKKLLRYHLPFIEIVESEIFRNPKLPTGGCWERLSAISVLCQESSIVQLDADTMTFGQPTEVIDGILNKRSFILRSEKWVEIQTLDLAAEYGKHLTINSQHIQAVTEARLMEIQDPERFRYVRGCAGFTGFSRRSISPESLHDLSRLMRNIHRSRWDEWGTEQVASNLMAASTPNAFMLPHPKYCNADSLTNNTVIAHYIGYARHVNRSYEKRADTAIALLKSI